MQWRENQDSRWLAETGIYQWRSEFSGNCVIIQKHFIQNFSTIAPLLTQLTQKTKFSFTNWCDEAFQKLKKALLFALILYNSSCFGQFLRDTDACNFGIGTVLSLIQDSEEQDIASKTLCQWSYCTTYGELIAVTFVKYIRYLFWSKNFPIGTNHSSLIWILKTRKVHA